MVMRDEQRDTAVTLEELLEPPDREDVKVVCGLVKKKGVRLRSQNLGQQDSQLESARERGEGLVVGRSGDTKSFKNFSGACFEGIAVRLNDQILEFGISVPVEVVLGRRQDLFFLGHGCPESPISHHDDIDDPLVFILKVVLFKDAEHGTLGDREFSVADALLSGQHLE